MRIFQNFNEMYSEVIRDLVEMGLEVKSHSVQGWKAGEHFSSDELLMKEIIGYAYRLENIKGWKDHFTEAEQRFVKMESGQRFISNLINPGKAYLNNLELWEPMLNQDGEFDYTYNERFRTQIVPIMHELRRRPNTRQAVMTMYESRDQKGFGGKFRIPCSLTYQFLIRGKRIHLIYNMRSCDYFNHFKIDVVLAYVLMETLAFSMDLVPGTLTHMMGSFHCFKRNWEEAGVF